MTPDILEEAVKLLDENDNKIEKYNINFNYNTTISRVYTDNHYNCEFNSGFARFKNVVNALINNDVDEESISNFEDEMNEEVKDEIKCEINEEVKDEIKNEINEEVKDEINKEEKEEVKEEVNEDEDINKNISNYDFDETDYYKYDEFEKIDDVKEEFEKKNEDDNYNVINEYDDTYECEYNVL